MRDPEALALARRAQRLAGCRAVGEVQPVFRLGETDGERFKLRPERALFMLIDQRPKGWHVQDRPDGGISSWLRAALEPFAPKPN